MLIITFLLGCGEDELEVPTVTVEFLGYEEEEAQFELNVIPAPTTELAVLLTFTSDNRDSFHIWAAISKGSHKEVFTVPLDRYVFWDVEILPLQGINLNDYPISDFEISVGRFNGYVLGDPSKVTTGPDETGPDGMVLIPAGNFQMGSDGYFHKERPVHTVYVDAFYIDTHEVTIGEYNRFVRETGHRALENNIYTYSPTNQHPVVGVSWHDAMAYATWTGKRLPTEAEWEKAARGGLVGRKYTWGSTMPNGTQCNFADKNGEDWFAHLKGSADGWNKNVDDGYTYAAPVGTYPTNPYGLYDMAGNVWEWCLDEYDEFFYADSPRDNPISGESIINLTNNFIRVNSPRVIRGGSWYSNSSGVRVAERHRGTSSDTFTNIGFRCVRAVTP